MCCQVWSCTQEAKAPRSGPIECPTGHNERERERVLHLSSHTGLMQVLPGHPRQIPECLTRAADSEERLQDLHISILLKKPRTTHLPLRQAKEASVIKSSNICGLCRQQHSANQTIKPCLAATTMGRLNRPCASLSVDRGCPKPIDRQRCLMSCLKLLTGDRQALTQAKLYY